MSRLLLWLGAVSALLAAVAAGCSPVVIEIPPSATPTQTATLTPSPVWFPATATPTPLPTLVRTPTPDFRPGVGELILEGGFEVEEGWFSFAGTIGNISFNEDHLTLAINQPPGMIYSFRETPVLTDFYAEVTVDINLCSGEDEYGLMVRVSGVQRYHYRFALTCSGEAKIVRASGSSPLVLQPLQSFPEIPVGFPGQVKMAVWVVGNELRCFANDRYLFSISDPVISEGAVGVYVRTVGDDPISINFSQLEIREIIE